LKKVSESPGYLKILLCQNGTLLPPRYVFANSLYAGMKSLGVSKDQRDPEDIKVMGLNKTHKDVEDGEIVPAKTEGNGTTPFIITDVREFRSMMQISTGPRPVKHIVEFEELDSKL
jgi:hypothetical protein